MLCPTTLSAQSTCEAQNQSDRDKISAMEDMYDECVGLLEDDHFLLRKCNGCKNYISRCKRDSGLIEEGYKHCESALYYIKNYNKF